METDIALDLRNVDLALELLHHHTKQIDPHELDLHHDYLNHLTSIIESDRFYANTTNWPKL